MSKWARDYWDALHPYNQHGGYINFMMEEGTDRIKNTYGGNYERLREVKATYDPDNFFHINQNIEPA
jgi:FAD/FMN-containing dehydrogenase